MTRILLTLALAAYNNVANLWPPFNRAAYVPTNLLLVAALAFVAFGPLELSYDEVVGDLAFTSALVGAALGALFAAPLFVASRWPRWRARIADERVAGLSGSALLYQCLVRVPIGTALTEEFAFRGVLFVAWTQSESTVVAALISSVVFGLWHIGPARNAVLANHPTASAATMARSIVLTVVGTTGAGLAFVWLRVVIGGILAPLVLHATLNSFATLAATRAHAAISANGSSPHWSRGRGP